MANIKDTITELIKKIFQYKVSEIIEKEGGLYVMIDVDAPVSQKIAQDIERKILDELSIKIIVCFIQNKITHKNKK
jgi:hypothetical protein